MKGAIADLESSSSGPTGNTAKNPVFMKKTKWWVWIKAEVREATN